MDDGRGQRLRQRGGELAADLLDGRDLSRPVDLPELREAAHLPLEIAAGARERRERGSGDIGRVDLGERVDEVEPEPAARRRARRGPAAASGRHDVALEVAHHVEVHAQNALVVAHRDDLRQADAVRREGELQPRLADHVVCGRRQRRPRRAPQHEAVGAPLEQEREVRAAAVADPARRDRSAAEAVLVEERLEPVEDQERRALEALAFLRGLNDVHPCDATDDAEAALPDATRPRLVRGRERPGGRPADALAGASRPRRRGRRSPASTSTWS